MRTVVAFGGEHRELQHLGSASHGGLPKLGVPSIMENQMEKKVENEMETGLI